MQSTASRRRTLQSALPSPPGPRWVSHPPACPSRHLRQREVRVKAEAVCNPGTSNPLLQAMLLLPGQARTHPSPRKRPRPSPPQRRRAMAKARATARVAKDDIFNTSLTPPGYFYDKLPAFPVSALLWPLMGRQWGNREFRNSIGGASPTPQASYANHQRAPRVSRPAGRGGCELPRLSRRCR